MSRYPRTRGAQKTAQEEARERAARRIQPIPRGQIPELDEIRDELAAKAERERAERAEKRAKALEADAQRIAESRKP